MNRMKWNIEKEIMVDMERGDIWVKSGEKLAGAELRILILLRRREGKPVTADMLADQVDPLDFGCSNPRFHIFNLRRKLGHCQERQVIETLKGIGYCLVPGSVQFTINQTPPRGE
jgi:DNA-binding response OmpR family regulator